MATATVKSGKKQVLKIGEINFTFPQPFAFVLKMRGHKFTDQELYAIDAANEDFKIESNAEGDLEIMPPPFPETSRKNMDIDAQLWIWAKKDKTGVCFESSAKFTLSNGAKRMPDAAWILKERYFALSKEEREERFTKIAPDFVIELRSKSDRLPILQKKMREYIENGVRLGWLIDPEKQRVHIYRGDKTVEILDKPTIVSGENVLQGFELDLTDIW
ncbi:MAG: Uma2 family endonuclease [Pyrinomonadaceae bacterium]|nr:Uma2 family endonuclease [Pyrinomonadaceae bacterium]